MSAQERAEEKRLRDELVRRRAGGESNVMIQRGRILRTEPIIGKPLQHSHMKEKSAPTRTESPDRQHEEPYSLFEGSTAEVNRRGLNIAGSVTPHASSSAAEANRPRAL